MFVKRFLLALVCVGAAGPQIASANSDWSWVRKNVLQRIEISGYRQLGYHIRSVSGDREAFNVGNYSGLGSRNFSDIGQISLSGRRVLGVLNFDATLLDSRFTDPQGQRWSIDFDRDGWRVNLGDIQGSLLNTNRFASISRSLRGAQVGYRAGKFQAKALASQAKARAQTISIPGNGSSGPYYLQSSQIVPESERVQVDGQTLSRGRDYVISYEVGAITFTTLAVPPSSSIVVSFEAFGTNARLGTIEGAALSYDFGPAGRVGVTAMRQRAANQSFGSTRLEKFFGFGAPSTPYVLQFEPLDTRPILIRVNGILQTEGVDYVFDTDNPATFFFTRFMPPTDEIDVVYVPRPRQTVDGDREVLGLDYRLQLGKQGTLTYNQATGRLKNEINPSIGVARGVSLDYNLGPVSVRATARDVPAGFVSVESLGFNRNERANDINLTYQPDNKNRIIASQSNSSVVSRRLNSNNQVTFNRSRVTNTGVRYSLTPSENDQPWQLSWDRKTSRVFGNPSRADTWTLGTSRVFKTWDYRFSLNRTDGSGPVSLNAGAATESFSVTGINAGVRWRPMSTLSLDLLSSLNAVRTGDSEGTGRRQDAILVYAPSDRLSVSARYSDTDSGGVQGLGGFNDGTGVGVDGSGFSGSVPGFSFLGATGSRLASIGIDYKPSRTLSIGLEAFQNRYTGSVSSNSQTTGAGINLFWQLPGETRISTRVDTSSTRFLGGDQRSSATTLVASLEGRLSPKWTYTFRGSSLISGGTSQFRQNGFTFEALSAYRISRKENLLFEIISGGTTGYLPQSDFTGALTYQYQLLDSIALNVGYRLRNVRNRDATATSGAYRAGSLDFELSFTFPR